MSAAWPHNVGILALELIFPSQFVDQTELERFDGASAGKYTIGLGQARMGFCSDRQDINSLCLTVVQQLLERYSIDVHRIGRLEVGTETIIDKSKSVKSVLMQLFEAAGVSDVEGVDTTNACYGGTAALFNAVNWVESSSWDGRLALVVCADIAVYAAGAARPTGGAGAVAMLIGPDAPLVFERGLRAHHMRHAYDFYKPDLSSEYPTVDGPLSIQCYLSALDACYQLYRSKAAAQSSAADVVDVHSFDALIFHTPFCKLVQKSVARLGVNDFVLTEPALRSERFGAALTERFADVRLADTYFDRDVEKAFLAAFNAVYEAKTRSSLLLAQQVGNMYTPSVYSGLVSLLINGTEGAGALLGKRIGVFSYGSGFAATMYSIRVTEDAALLAGITERLAPLRELLERREKVAPEEFTRLMEVRERNIHAAPYEPSGSVEALFPGTYYLKSIDAKHRREYGRVPPQ